MRPLVRPSLSARSVLDACIISIRDERLTENLSGATDAIVNAEKDYLAKGEDLALYSIPESDHAASLLTTAEMKRVYKETFVKSRVTRGMYEKLKTAPENDMCPLCAQRPVSGLDHYLAQSRHPTLTLVPLNLVPACDECNKSKLDRQPLSEAEQSFHPYFDDFDDAQWLTAEVVETKPAAVRFSVSAPPSWTSAKIARAETHFTMFGLGALYASHAGVEINNMRFSLTRIARSGTAKDVRLELEERAESARDWQLNAWQTATYEALAASAWFCSGGFLA